MTEERIKEIEKVANECGLSFASAKLMLEECDEDIYCQTMAELMY